MKSDEIGGKICGRCCYTKKRLSFVVAVKRLKITRHLEHVEVEEEGTAVFSCELSHEAPGVQWLLNDRVIHASHINKIQNSGKVYTLVLKRLTLQESRVTFKAVGISESTILRVKGEDCGFYIYSNKKSNKTFIWCFSIAQKGPQCF